jgi:arylsulfatase
VSGLQQFKIVGDVALPPGETTDVGSDAATPVSDDYGTKDSEFTGRIDWVQIDIDENAEDLDHLITPEERLRIAMGGSR